MKNSIRKFLEFNGKVIYYLSKDGEYWIAVKPICEALGVYYHRQQKNIRSDKILGQLWSNQTIVAADNRVRKMFCLPEKYIYGWIFSIRSNSPGSKNYLRATKPLSIMITKTSIRALLLTLITDREYCMNHGEMAKTGDLVAICTRLSKDLEWHRLHGHNAHTAIVRQNASGIRKLANTLGRKYKLREQILEMVDKLSISTDAINRVSTVSTEIPIS